MRPAFVTGAVVLAVLAVSACGSSKPDYCSKTNDLEQSVKGLANVNIQSNGVDALKSQLKKVQSDATAVVNAAKSDFPGETSALSSSVDALGAALKNVPSSPSPAQIVTITGEATGVATTVKGFADATGSKCS